MERISTRAALDCGLVLASRLIAARATFHRAADALHSYSGASDPTRHALEQIVDRWEREIERIESQIAELLGDVRLNMREGGNGLSA